MPIYLRVIFFVLLLGLAEYYSFVVLKSALRSLPPNSRTVIIILYFLFTAICWFGLITLRTIAWQEFLPHWARNVFVAFCFGLLVGKVLILGVMLIDDIRRFGLWLMNLFYIGGVDQPLVDSNAVKIGISRSVFLSRLAIILGGVALTGFLYGMTNRYRYRLKRVALNFPKLPESFRGLKVVQISDIHSGSFDDPEAVLKGVQHIMDERPDLILFTGDLVNNQASEMADYKAIFGKLKAPLGVYSILGNHDYGDYHNWPSEQAKIDNLNQLKQTHAEMGWKLMMNEHVLLTRGEDSIALLGVENWSAKPQFPKHGRMDLAYAGLAEKNIPFKLLMSHDPSHWDAQVLTDYKDIDLTLSGHTHGMQFGVEIGGFKWSPVSLMYKKWAGLYQEGNQSLYVNRGFGFLAYPGRIGILPEITVFTLT